MNEINAMNLKLGSIIRNNKTKINFRVTEIILESRDPPEYILENVENGKVYDPTYGLWLMQDDWVLISL